MSYDNIRSQMVGTDKAPARLITRQHTFVPRKAPHLWVVPPPALEGGADTSGGAPIGVANGPEADKLPVQAAPDDRPTKGSVDKETNATESIGPENRAGSSEKLSSSTIGKSLAAPPKKAEMESNVVTARDVSGMA